MSAQATLLFLYLADDVTNAVTAVFRHNPPRFLARTPHGYHDVALIRKDLRCAGFADAQIETQTKASCAPSARDVATAYCLGMPLRNQVEGRDAGLFSSLWTVLPEAIASRRDEGPVTGKLEAHVVVAAR